MSQPGLAPYAGYSAPVASEPPPGLTPGKVWEMVKTLEGRLDGRGDVVTELRRRVAALEARVAELEAHAPGQPAWKGTR